MDGRENEEDLFAMIRRSPGHVEAEDPDDGSQFLNDSGEGMEEEGHGSSGSDDGEEESGSDADAD